MVTLVSDNSTSPAVLNGEGNKVSVLVLTLNEQDNLPRCLASLSFSDDIVVLDSFSTDRTVEIAKAAGARVVQRKFDDWASHQNWAVENIRFKNRWVYYSDADEVADPELASELQQRASDPATRQVAFRIRRKDMLWGRWLRHSSMYPIWLTRFFRPEAVRWKRLVNPTVEVRGEVGVLKGHIIHHSFSKGLDAWIAKHIQYAYLESLEAIRFFESEKADLAGILAVHDPVRRRGALKMLAWYLPFRPFWRFLYMYVLRLGCLDGTPGYVYCRLVSTYQQMIDCQIREQRRRLGGSSM